MAETVISGDAARIQRNRAPLAAISSAPSAATNTKPQGNEPSVSVQNGQSNAPLFTVPIDEKVMWAAEVPAKVPGITDGDSYLIMTMDDEYKYRAFIVPKDGSGQQREISATDARVDTVKKQFHATVGKGHNLVIGLVSSFLDGRSIRNVDTYNDSPETDWTGPHF